MGVPTRGRALLAGTAPAGEHGLASTWQDDVSCPGSAAPGAYGVLTPVSSWEGSPSATAVLCFASANEGLQSWPLCCTCCSGTQPEHQPACCTLAPQALKTGFGGCLHY